MESRFPWQFNIMTSRKKARICAAIVTYNRKKLLAELLDSLSRQTHPVQTIIIVNNHSSDETSEMLLEKEIIEKMIPDDICKSRWNDMEIAYFHSSSNLGGAGGFQKAFEIARRMEHDFVWVMDDDVEPEETCLERLLDAMSQDALVCIPNRIGNGWNDRVVLKYNLSNPFLINVWQYKNQIDCSDIKEEIVFVDDMPFEGPLISTEIIQRAGVPDSRYFLFFDDSDYARRLLQFTSIKYVKNASMKKKLPKTTKMNEEWRHYYYNRNAFYFDRIYGKNMLVRRFRPFFSFSVRGISLIVRGRGYRANILRRAYVDAVKGRMGKRSLQS